MKATALATEHKLLSQSNIIPAALDEPLEFFVVPATFQGFMWLAQRKLLGKKLRDPGYNRDTGTIVGKML